MNDVWPVAVKALNGGIFVVAFSLLGEVAVPKRFAGLFSAAPSIALANLVVTALVSGAADAKTNGEGMVVGAIALFIATFAGIAVLRHRRAMPAAICVCTVWLALACLGYIAVLR